MKKIDSMIIRMSLSVLCFILSILFPGKSFILSIIGYIIISYDLYKKAFQNIKRGEIFDENFLMIIASLGAFYIEKNEEAFLVILLYQIGEYLSDLAVDRSKESILNLMDLRSDKARIKEKDTYKTVEAKKVKIGDIVLIKPGEKVPLDGIVIKGSSYIDTSSLTGESLLRKVNKKDEVLSGYINKDSALEIKVTKKFEKSTASQIIELMEKSQEKKTKTEKFITRFAKIYTPIIVVCALLITIVPVCLGYPFEEFLTKSLIFLVVSCPCALVISVPLGFFTGIGRASKEGILIKGGDTIDLLEKAEIVCLDKTGTLTKGRLEVTNIEVYEGTKENLLEIAAHAEYYSDHPIAKAILKSYKQKIEKKRIEEYHEIEGKGITVKIDKIPYLIGNQTFMKENKIEINAQVEFPLYIAKEKQLLGAIAIADAVKENSKNSLKELKKVGIKEIIMVSGDTKENCQKVANEIGIDTYHAKMLPIDKVEIIEKQKSKGITIFIGDGINDAPVIKMADIGISMGALGSDAAIKAADIVLMRDDLMKISLGINLSKRMKKIIRFNIAFAIGIKTLILILSLFGYTNIWAAVFADVGVTLLSVLNALRIRKIHL